MSNIVPNGADINDINSNVTSSDLSWNINDGGNGNDDDIGALLSSLIIVDFSFAFKTIELPYDNDDVNDVNGDDDVNDDDGNWNDNILLKKDNKIKNTITIIILIQSTYTTTTTTTTTIVYYFLNNSCPIESMLNW